MQTWFLGWNPTVRALTGAATLICSAVAAVCDRPVQLSCISRAVEHHVTANGPRLEREVTAADAHHSATAASGMTKMACVKFARAMDAVGVPRFFSSLAFLGIRPENLQGVTPPSFNASTL